MRVGKILGKINIDTHLEGCWNDVGIMEEIAWGLDVWGRKEILEEDGVEGFEIGLGRCLEEDEVEAFGSLNVNLDLFLIFKSFKRDLGIHINFELSFSFDSLECISLMMNLGTHIFFDFTFWIVNLYGRLNVFLSFHSYVD